MAGKKKDALAGVNMAMSLSSQANKELAKLKRMAKKPGKVKTKPINMQLASNSIQKPGAFNIKRNTIMKAEHGGEVMNTTRATQLNPITGEPIQEYNMASKLQKSQQIDKLLVRLEKLGPDDKYAGSKQKDEIDFIKGQIQKLLPDMKKDGGAVKKMKLGGEAKPLVGNQFKLDKNKNGRIDGGDFAKMEMGGKVKEYGGGGKVKGGKMTCRGMGAAVKGGGFSISQDLKWRLRI